MKKKKITTVRASKIEELTKSISELEHDLAKKMIDRFTNQPKNTREIKRIRRDIAVMKSILQEKLLSKENQHEK